MTRHRISSPAIRREGASLAQIVTLIGALLVTVAIAAVALWFVFNPQTPVSPSFWDGSTDVLRMVRLLGACQ